MENASRALIMAASVLLGIMIISVGMALFRSFGGSGARIMDAIEQNQIDEFNNQFLKYQQEEGITIHDVITIVNLAQKNNEQYEVAGESERSDNSNYVQVEFKKGPGTIANFEKKNETEIIKELQDSVKNTQIEYHTLIGEDGKEVIDDKGNKVKDLKRLKNPYKIADNGIEIASGTRRVNYVKIVPND